MGMRHLNKNLAFHAFLAVVSQVVYFKVLNVFLYYLIISITTELQIQTPKSTILNAAVPF